MSIFIRLLKELPRDSGLAEVCKVLRSGENDSRCYEIDPLDFEKVPGSPFCYWVSDGVRATFEKFNSLESDGRTLRQGLATAEDFRFVRAWWEVDEDDSYSKWIPFAKGGAYSPIYSDLHLVVNWHNHGEEIKAGICRRYPYLNGNPDFVAKNTDFYFRPGLTWTHRTTSRLGLRAYPAGAIFGHKGPVAFVHDDHVGSLLALLAITTSSPFIYLVEMLVAAGDAAARSYDNGLLQVVPFPHVDATISARLGKLAAEAWALNWLLDVTNEVSHAFILPAVLFEQFRSKSVSEIEDELNHIAVAIDDIAFDLYGFTDSDRVLALHWESAQSKRDLTEDASEAENNNTKLLQSLLHWAVGVIFGRFDIGLATGQRTIPDAGEPFAKPPTKSLGMLDRGGKSDNTIGILVDDIDNTNDIPTLLLSVLEDVGVECQIELRQWLRSVFFKDHLSKYSMSRRKAPIYWPISTPSGSYTLWIYYPLVDNQTLYAALNDFLKPKIKFIENSLAQLRSRSNRTAAEEGQLKYQADLYQELVELRDEILEVAPDYKPNRDDGVQITAAPLWPLFRHKPWQKALRDTWAKLENGDYDWAHLAYSYWPDRVREKCKTDKSLAIAHGLEELYEEPAA